MTIGIYALYWEEQDLIYIGQSVDLEKRKNQHFKALLHNVHTNYKVQEAYNNYGIPEFIIIEECEELKLIELEIYWTEEFNALNSLCIVDPKFGISNTGENNLYSKYTKIQYLYVFRLLSSRIPYKIKDIAIFCNITEAVVNDILYGRKHKWLQDNYPFRYSLMLKRNIDRKLISINRVSAIFINTEGIREEVNNLTNFAKKYNLTPATLSKVYRGERVSHKGWRLA